MGRNCTVNVASACMIILLLLLIPVPVMYIYEGGGGGTGLSFFINEREIMGPLKSYFRRMN